jgi:hypothetical protein
MMIAQDRTTPQKKERTMPRITTITNFADRFKPSFTTDRECLDYCLDCFRRADLAAEHFDDAVDLDADHIDYTDPAYAFECCICKCKLSSNDN